MKLIERRPIYFTNLSLEVIKRLKKISKAQKLPIWRIAEEILAKALKVKL